MRKHSIIALLGVVCLLAGAASAQSFDGAAVNLPQPQLGDTIGIDALASGAWVAHDGANVLGNSDPTLAAAWNTGPALAAVPAVVAADAKDDAALVVVGTGAVYYVTPTTVTSLSETVEGAVFGEALNNSNFALAVNGAAGEIGILSKDANDVTNTRYCAVIVMPEGVAPGGLVAYQGTLYASTDSATGEIRAFNISQLLMKRNRLVGYYAEAAAKQLIGAPTPFDWEDGRLIGTASADGGSYNGFGVTAVTNRGTLLGGDTAEDGSALLMYIKTFPFSKSTEALSGDSCSLVVYNSEDGHIVPVMVNDDGSVTADRSTEAVEARRTIFSILQGMLGGILALSILSYLIAWLFF